MSAPATNLAPPKTDKISLQELARHDGTNGDTIYVAIKGTVFDVSGKRDMYGPGGSYHIFAGKDGSKGLGLSSLKAEDAIPDYSTLGSALTSDLAPLESSHASTRSTDRMNRKFLTIGTTSSLR
ncbi:hypothetical protein FRC02_005552 [Tulasnella sp. 418]|nr:hypothetical protein FRC02_005552 [Tulasnella sp. 418]